MRLALALLIALTTNVYAKGETPGAFDYFVLALSWEPSYCAIDGDRKGDPSCTDSGDGWVLHGLWPQFEDGWPSYCPNKTRAPSRRDVRAMSDIMGSETLARHQWNKHGTCSGMTATEYFEASRTAYEAVVRPDVFRRLDETVRLPARVVEDAFLDANPDLDADQLTVTCKNRHIQEVRICLTKDLDPRACGADVRRDCRQEDAVFPPVR